MPEAISLHPRLDRKMDTLINAILKLSREGRRNLKPEAVDLDELFDAIADSAPAPA